VVNNADRHELLSVVATVHHERVGETLNDWALCLSESLLGISAGSVGDVDWGADLDVVADSKVSWSDLPVEPIVRPGIRLQLGFLTSRRCHGSRHPRSSCQTAHQQCSLMSNLNPPPGERTTC